MSSAHSSSELAQLALVGASGRMGSAIARCALGEASRTLALRVAVVPEGSGVIGNAVDGHAGVSYAGPSAAAATLLAGLGLRAHGPETLVLCDFSSPGGVAWSIEIAERLASDHRGGGVGGSGVVGGAGRVALLVGVTGLDRPEHQALVARLRALSHRCAVLVTPNTSLGVAAVAHAAAGLARALGPGYSWTMAETHHTRKKDAPSGTALRLAQAIASGGVTMEASAIRSIREGEVVGTHTIAIEGPGEVIELTHRATTRDLFAHGALRCCAFLAGRPAGWYTMEDVVGRA